MGSKYEFKPKEGPSPVKYRVEEAHKKTKH